MRVMIAVTHLLGTGHLRRAHVLADAFASAGHSVLLASGGLPLDLSLTSGTQVLQLPPLRSDGVNFARLLNSSGQPADDILLARRMTMLCDAVTEFLPDIVITELFPFGRRTLAAEFTALLDCAHALTPRPVILSSVRDILAPPSKPAKATRAQHLISSRYDAVLVHSDPQGTTLDQSWPVDDTLAPMLRYTGYVTAPPPTPHPDGTGKGEVLVSAGGGTVGTGLFETAITAAGLMPELHWRLLVAGDPGRLTALRAQSKGTNTSIEPTRPDFRNMLPHAAISVSLCGYNTAMDVLQARIPAVFVPFDDGTEIEQTLRANSLSHLAGITTLPNRDLSPERLCTAIRIARAQPDRDALPLRFDGATQSVAIAVEMAKARK